MFIMKIAYPYFCGLLLLLLTGCAALSESPAPSPMSFPLVSVGLTKAEVEQKMGTKLTVGYKKRGPSGDFEPITINQPYRTESVSVDGEDWEVYYYFIRVKQPDGQITDDELEPFLFRDGRLMGRGWPFLRDLKKAPRPPG